MTPQREQLEAIIHKHMLEWKAGHDQLIVDQIEQLYTPALTLEEALMCLPAKLRIGDEIAENRSYTAQRIHNALIDDMAANLRKAAGRENG